MNSTPSPPRARINVKLAAGPAGPPGEHVLNGTPGLLSVTALFPDEADHELRSLYVVEVEPDQLPAAMERLQQNPHVESAEQTARRKLIR